MKNSLTLKLVLLIASTILISSLITALLIHSLTVRRFTGYALERDREVARAVAAYLSDAAGQGRLEETLLSLFPPDGAPSLPAPPEAMSRRGHHRMMRASPPPEKALPLLIIADASGRVLRASLPEGLPRPQMIPPERLREGAPYFSTGRRPAGYVLAGTMLAGVPSKTQERYLRYLLTGMSLATVMAVLLASLIGLAALRVLLRPLRSLHKGVRLLAEGDYGYRVESPGQKDELSLLAAGFNEMAASIQRSEQWKKQIISDTAHELRTPVSLIMGNLEMMMEGVYRPDPERLRALYDESAHLAELIKDLQQLAAAESSLPELRRESFSPDELAAQTLEGFQAAAREKEIRLRAEGSFRESWEGDPRKIRQVLKNLLSNALRHSPPRGEVVLRTLRREDALVIEVRDQGPGVPPEERTRIFDRFYRIDKARNRRDGGRGLGLAISKAIIERHGGTVGVSENPGGGALFFIRLPL